MISAWFVPLIEPDHAEIPRKEWAMPWDDDTKTVVREILSDPSLPVGTLVAGAGSSTRAPPASFSTRAL